MRFILSILLIANFISCTNNNTKSENKSIAVGDSLAEIAFLDSIDMPCIYNDSVKKDFTFENELEEVVIVSYKNVRTFTQNKSKEKNEIIKNGKIHFKNFKEKLILKQNEIDSLKKKLFNYSRQSDIISSADCYFPRHCIYFMGKKQKVIAYLEICFECSKYESNNPDLKILCWNQFDILKNFLKNCGVKEGFDINSMDPNSSKK